MTKHPVSNEPAILAKALELVLAATTKAGRANHDGARRPRPAGAILRECGVLLLPSTDSCRLLTSAIVSGVALSNKTALLPCDVERIKKRWAECVDQSAIAIVVWG